jgi:hypothetical protein
MVQRKPRFALPETSLKIALTAILSIIAILPGTGLALTAQFPEASVVKGRTTGGHPYMSGGFSVDERRVMEHAAQAYNLKLVFVRRAGTPVTPAFVIIGANESRRIEKIALRALVLHSITERRLYDLGGFPAPDGAG